VTRRKRSNTKETLAQRVILVVDDDPAILSACTRALRHIGQVVTTTDPAIALRLARAVHPDTAIVDLRLGQESGIPLIRALKKLRPGTRIALLSGYLSIDDAVAAVKAGADVVVAKPITPVEIVRRLDSESQGAVGPTAMASLGRVEWQHVHGALADANGNVTHAARRLGIFRTSLQRKLRKPMPRG
jgi:two-component system response regulator RegA